MMIDRYACFANKQSTSTNQSFIAVDPNVEVLLCLVSGKRNMHAFHNAAALGCREKQGTQKNLG